MLTSVKDLCPIRPGSPAHSAHPFGKDCRTRLMLTSLVNAQSDSILVCILGMFEHPITCIISDEVGTGGQTCNDH
jgi:hypothetical protein